MSVTIEEQLRTYAEEDITIPDSSTRLTVTNALNPFLRKIEIFVEDAQIRFRMDGTAPTATVGEILNPFDRLTIYNALDARNFRAIRTGGTSATLRVRYKRRK